MGKLIRRCAMASCDIFTLTSQPNCQESRLSQGQFVKNRWRILEQALRDLSDEPELLEKLEDIQPSLDAVQYYYFNSTINLMNYDKY